MPIQTQLSKRKKIGARGPLTAKRGAGGEPLLMTALNMTLVVTYIVLLVVSAWFFGQVLNVDSDENRAALGVDGTGTGALSLRNDLVHQCDTNLLNAPWYESKTDNHLRLRCVPSHLASKVTSSVDFVNADWGTLEQLEYVLDETADKVSGDLKIRLDTTDKESLKKTPRKPLASCAADLRCQPGYQCVLIPLPPVQCDVSKHSRCVCSGTIGGTAAANTGDPDTNLLGIGDKGELTTMADENNICWSSLKDARNRAGGVMKGFNDFDVQQTCSTLAKPTNRCIADDGESFSGTKMGGLDEDDLEKILGKVPVDPGGKCTRKAVGIVPAITTTTSTVNTKLKCLAECACSTAIVLSDDPDDNPDGASTADPKTVCKAKTVPQGGGAVGEWVCGEWESTKRRLSRHKKHHKHRTRSHKDDPLTEKYDRLKPPVEHTVTNGQRLHELLYGATDSSRLTEGQYGPALAVLILSSLSVLSSVVVWVYDYFFAMYSDRASIQGTDGGQTIFGKNKMWGRLGIALTVGTNIVDFLTDMGVFVLYQRAMYNNHIDEPYGTSLVWFEAGCYHGGANMSLKPKHEIDVNKVEVVQSPADLGGDGGLATVLLVVVVVRFFVYRVLGTSLFTGSIEI